MNYEKDTFVVIPNKHILKGKPAEMQAIFFWICEHANGDGNCFPGRLTLMREAGVSLRTLDKYLKELINIGLISVVQRKSGKQNLTNVYQIQVVAKVIPGVEQELQEGSSKNDMRGSSKNDTVTLTNINSTQLTQLPEPEVSGEARRRKELFLAQREAVAIVASLFKELRHSQTHDTWIKMPPQREACVKLMAFGESEVRKRLAMYSELEKMDRFNAQYYSPHQMIQKWDALTELILIKEGKKHDPKSTDQQIERHYDKLKQYKTYNIPKEV